MRRIVAPITRRCFSMCIVVSENEYNAYLNSLEAKGQTGEAKGPAQANVPAKSGSEEGTR